MHYPAHYTFHLIIVIHIRIFYSVKIETTSLVLVWGKRDWVFDIRLRLDLSVHHLRVCSIL